MPAVTSPTSERPGTPATAAPVAYFWGDDAYGIDAAAEAVRTDPARFPAGAPERWRIRGEAGDAARILGELRERLATGTMFGSGTLAILSNAGPLVRRGEDRDALVAAIGLLADGNGLVVAEETDSGKKDPPSKVLADAVRAAGGERPPVRGPARGRAGRVGGGARPGARDRPRPGSGPRARDPDRRLRPRRGRGSPPAGPARRHGAREAGPSPRPRRGPEEIGGGSGAASGQTRLGGRRPRARRRGRPGLDLGVRGRGRDAPAIALAGAPGAAPRGDAGARPPRRPAPPDPRAHRGGGPSRRRGDAGIARPLDAPPAVPRGDARAPGPWLDGRASSRPRSRACWSWMPS